MAKSKPEEISSLSPASPPQKKKNPKKYLTNHAEEFQLFPIGNRKSLKEFKIFRTMTTNV